MYNQDGMPLSQRLGLGFDNGMEEDDKEEDGEDDENDRRPWTKEEDAKVSIDFQ
jgi:hypothetical protein